MTPKEAHNLAHYIPAEPKHETDELLCIHCNKWSALSLWTVAFFDCDTCGWVETMKCPECEEINGAVHLHDGPIQVREVAQGETP